jgi:hypothetical protein
MSKFKSLKNVIHSPNGALEVISLLNFLNLVDCDAVTRKDEWQDNKIMQLRTGEIFGASSYYGDLSNWENEPKKILVELVQMGFTRTNRLDILRFFIMDQAVMSDVSNKDLNEVIHNEQEEHLYNFGNPTHLVRVAQRLWMVANPEDFVIFMNKEDSKIGLFVKDEKRTRVISVHRGEPRTFRMLGQN